MNAPFLSNYFNNILNQLWTFCIFKCSSDCSWNDFFMLTLGIDKVETGGEDGDELAENSRGTGDDRILHIKSGIFNGRGRIIWSWNRDGRVIFHRGQKINEWIGGGAIREF